MGRIASRNLAISACILGGCAERPMPMRYAKAETAIPELASMPYRIYAIDDRQGSTWRISLDGVERVELVRSRAVRAGEWDTRIRLSRNGTLYPGSRPSTELSLDGVFGGLGSIVLQRDSRSANTPMDKPPVWEEFSLDPKPKPAKLSPGSQAVGIGSLKDANSFESLWAIRYVAKTTDDRSHIGEVVLTRKRFPTRSHRFAAGPLRMVKVLGIFKSRWVILHDNPHLLLWDLDSGRKRLIIDAVDVTAAQTGPEKNMLPQATLRVGRDEFAWDLAGPDDIEVKEQYRVRRPSQ